MLVLALTSALAAPPAGAAAPSLEEARRDRAAVQKRLDAAADRLAGLEAETARLEVERTALADEAERLRSEVAAADARLRTRVRELYKRGSTDPIVLLLSGHDPDDALERAATMGRLIAGDRSDIEVATNARTRATAIAGRLAEREAALAAARAEQRRVAEALQEDLAAAQALETRLEAEDRARRAAAAARRAAEERARRAAPRDGGTPAASGGRACPMARPHSFTDTWGAPRSGGRRHRGTDILGPRGQQVLAIVDGVWDVRSYGRSAGHWAILKGADGTSYWYLHLERHLVADGARVRAGQVVATNGDTGNARGTTPHVHFEQHPGGSRAVNPYPLLRRLCG